MDNSKVVNIRPFRKNQETEKFNKQKNILLTVRLNVTTNHDELI